MGIRPAKDLSLSHAPDTAEDSKPTAALPLLLRPVAALQPRISAAERSRSLYFRCKEQRKQLVHTVIQLMQLDVPSALSRGPSAHGLVPWGRPGSTFAVGTGFRRCSAIGMSDGASLPDQSGE